MLLGSPETFGAFAWNNTKTRFLNCQRVCQTITGSQLSTITSSTCTKVACQRTASSGPASSAIRESEDSLRTGGQEDRAGNVLALGKRQLLISAAAVAVVDASGCVSMRPGDSAYASSASIFECKESVEAFLSQPLDYTGPGPLSVVHLPRLETVCTSCFDTCMGTNCLLRVDVTYPKGGAALGLGPPYPLAIFSSGFFVGSENYKSYADRLASWGYTVLLYDKVETVSDALDDVTSVRALRQLIDWAGQDALVARIADTSRVYLVGHSRGGKLSALAGAQDDRVAAVCLLDPVDNTVYAPLSPGYPSAIVALKQQQELQEQQLIKKRLKAFATRTAPVTMNLNLNEQMRPDTAQLAPVSGTCPVPGTNDKASSLSLRMNYTSLNLDPSNQHHHTNNTHSQNGSSAPGLQASSNHFVLYPPNVAPQEDSLPSSQSRFQAQYPPLSQSYQPGVSAQQSRSPAIAAAQDSFDSSSREEGVYRANAPLQQVADTAYSGQDQAAPQTSEQNNQQDKNQGQSKRQRDGQGQGLPTCFQGAARELPVALVGSGVGGDCAPREANYKQFYRAAPGPTWELEIQDSGHFSYLDQLTPIQRAVCPAGDVPEETVRNIAQAAMVVWAELTIRGRSPSMMMSNSAASAAYPGACNLQNSAGLAVANNAVTSKVSVSNTIGVVSSRTGGEDGTQIDPASEFAERRLPKLWRQVEDWLGIGMRGVAAERVAIAATTNQRFTTTPPPSAVTAAALMDAQPTMPTDALQPGVAGTPAQDVSGAAMSSNVNIASTPTVGSGSDAKAQAAVSKRSRFAALEPEEVPELLDRLTTQLRYQGKDVALSSRIFLEPERLRQLRGVEHMLHPALRI